MFSGECPLNRNSGAIVEKTLLFSLLVEFRSALDVQTSFSTFGEKIRLYAALS